MHDDTTILNAIHAVLDGTEWDSDTTVAIADLVQATGRVIRQPEEA